MNLTKIKIKKNWIHLTLSESKTKILFDLIDLCRRKMIVQRSQMSPLPMNYFDFYISIYQMLLNNKMNLVECQCSSDWRNANHLRPLRLICELCAIRPSLQRHIIVWLSKQQKTTFFTLNCRFPFQFMFTMPCLVCI